MPTGSESEHAEQAVGVADGPAWAGLEGSIAELSRRLLSLETGDPERAAREGLSAAAQLAGADLCSLLLTEAEAPQGVRRVDWRRPGVDAPLVDTDPEVTVHYRWAAGRLAGGLPLHIPSSEDLPDEARPEREDMQRRGVCSHLTIPVRSRDEVVGYLIFERTSGHRAWSDREITLLGLAAEIVAGAVQRTRTEAALERQVGWEQRIAELSRRFLASDAGAFEDAMRLGLETVLEISGGDRAYLLGLETRQARVTLVFEHALPGVPVLGNEAAGSMRDQYPWAQGQLARGGVLEVPDVAALPPEAATEAEVLRRRGTRALLGISVRAGKGLSGYLAVEATRGPRHWRSAEVGKLQLVAEILASLMRRQRAEVELARQVDFEQRIAELSRRFLALDAREVDEAIEEALCEAAGLAAADRAYLLSFRSLRDPYDIYQWCAAGVERTDPKPLPWATAQVLAGELLCIPELSRLPEEAQAERRDLAARGVVSFLGIPVFSGPDLIGFIAFESLQQERWWSEQDITLLRLVGELLTSALRRKRTEDALRESQAQLLQSQKMEAVGRLAGGIAHDFNNLLTVILGFSRAVRGDLETDSPLREDLDEIHDAAERAAALTRQLLTFSRRQRLESRMVDLNETISGLQEMLRRLLGEDVELVIQTSSHRCAVEGDPNQIEQVIINLAVNARDAMPDGGELRVTTGLRSVDPEERPRLGLAQAGEHVVLSVSDSGEGVEESLRERIFEPFFTTKEPGKGTGLGLSIVYSIVEQAGGAISVYGGRAKGTVFEILLPRATEERDEDAESAGPSPARGDGTVLLVEDEPAVRRLARRILERSGYRVIEASDGVDALEVARRHRGPLDLLLSDVVMPRMSGGELARRLREERPGIAVLFVSGYPQARGHAASSLEDDAFLFKPFSGRVLLERVRDTLGRG